jgi:hypothetical protein
VHGQIVTPFKTRTFRINVEIGRDGIPSFFKLSLITDLAEKVVPPCDILLSFDPFGRAAVNDAKHTAALLTLSNDNFDGIRGRAEYRAHFGHVSNRVHHIDGVRILQHQHKGVATGKRLGVADSDVSKRLVVSF